MKRLTTVLSCLLVLSGCAALMGPAPTINLDKAKGIVESISLSEARIGHFFATGTLTIEEKQVETRLGFFWAGSRNPLRLKIELAHPWGGQVLEALVARQEVCIRDHLKRLSYRGPWSGSLLNRVFPGLLTPEALWTLLAGRLPLMGHKYLRVQGPDKILLLDQTGRIVQVIGIDAKEGLPIWTAYPKADLELWFSWRNEKIQDIPHAKRIRINLAEQGRSIIIQFKSLVYDKPIPEDVFKPPPGPYHPLS